MQSYESAEFPRPLGLLLPAQGAFVPVVAGFVDPTSVANCALWIDASDGASVTFSSGVKVSQINDKSGNSRHFTQSNASLQLTLVSAAKNGLSALFSDPANSNYMTNSLSFSQPMYYFAVVEWEDVSTVRYLFDGSAGDPHRNAVFINSSTPDVYAGGEMFSSSAVGATTWYVFSWLFNGASSVVRRNGGADNTGDVGTEDVTGLILAARNGASSFHSGYIGELIVYSAALSSTDRDAVEGYLRSKWAI